MRFSVEKIKRALFLTEDGEDQLSDREKEKIKQDAESKGLVSLGFGNYGKKAGEPATHTVKNGKLVPVGGEDGEAQQDTQGPQGPPPEASDSVDDVLDTINGDDETQGADADGKQDIDGQDNNTDDSEDDKPYSYQDRIDQNRDKIEKFRDMRNNISSEDDMTKYEDYLLNTIENNHETIGDALDELMNIEDSFDEKDPITNFTSQAYDGAGHRLSMISLAARYPDGNTSDFRVERMKKRCEEKDPQFARDCENYSPYDEPTPQDIEAFKKLQQNQQQSLVDLGLVDEDGMVTVYRGMSGLGDQGPVDYKGSAVDSWSMSPRTAWAFSEAYDSKNMLKAKVPLDRVILAAASSTEEQFNHSYEFEVTIDSIGLDNVESVDSSGDMKKIMENTMAKTKMRIIKKNGKYKIIKESKGIPVDINNDKDTDWLRSNRKEKEQDHQVEESALTEAGRKRGRRSFAAKKAQKAARDKTTAADLSDADKKKIKDLEWKGQGWGPKNKDFITYKRDDNGKLVAVDKDGEPEDNQGQDATAPAQGTDGNDSSADDVIGVATGNDGDDTEKTGAQSDYDDNGGSDYEETPIDKKEDTPKDKKEIDKIRANLPEGMDEADPSIARAIYYGYNRSPKGCKGNQCIWVPAPGNNSSLLNETLSMVGSEILRQNPNMSDEQLEEEMENRFGNTKAWKEVTPATRKITLEAARTKHEKVSDAMEKAVFGKESKYKSYYGTAESLTKQHDAVMQHEGPFYGGNGEEITSIPTDAESKIYLKKYKDPKTGEPISEEEAEQMLKDPTNPKVIRRFLALTAYNGGGGANPSDTATIITDGDKMMFTAFSDKTSLGDQQANSTPRQLLTSLIETTSVLKEEGYNISEKDEKQTEKRLQQGRKEFETAEKEYAAAVAAPFGVMRDLIKDGNEIAIEIFNDVFSETPNRQETIDKKLASIPTGKPVLVNKTQSEILEKNNINPAPSWEDYLKQVGWDGKSEITDNLKKAALLASVADDRTVTFINDDGEEETATVGAFLNPKKLVGYYDQVVNGVGQALDKKPPQIKLGDEQRGLVVNKNKNAETARKKAIDAVQRTFDDLSKTKIQKEGGEPVRLGDALSARDMVKALHLGMIDEENAPGLFYFGSCDIVAGKHSTTPERMRDCTCSDTVDDLTGNIKTKKPAKSGPVDEETGLTEGELSRSRDKLAINDEGKKQYIVDGEYVWFADGDVPKGGDVKGPLGIVTGRKVFAYTLDKEGNEISIGEMSMRTKGGMDLQTTYIYANSLKKCLEGKADAPCATNEQIEMPDYLLRMLERL